jgi:hypothetical protein
LKIDVTSIIFEHWRTLYDARRHRVAYIDVLVFYVAPFVVAMGAYWCGLIIKPDQYSTSITFFGIFLALLLNIQVATFSIFLRRWQKPTDNREENIQARELKDRRLLLSELNANVAYLTVFSTFSLVLFLSFYIFGATSSFCSGVAIFVYLHFIFTLLMVIKRSHALFQKEYRDSPD